MIEVEIPELDLSPIEVVEFDAQGETLKFLQPLRLVPYLDLETQTHILVERAEFGIHVFAPTVPLLMDELREQRSGLERLCPAS